MELAYCQDGSSSDARGGRTSQPDCAKFDDDRILEAVNTATKEYGFCLNRIWATARSLPRGIWDLPNLLRPSDQLKEVFGHKGEQGKHQIKNNLHKQCTLDFCEQSQVNFTSISQRHESPFCSQGLPCEPLEGLFSRDTLDKAVEKVQDRPTAWRLNGAAIVEDGQKYMAISHVWSDGTGAGAWDGLKVNKCLYHFFRKLAREFECEGIWWDAICVPGKKALREKALANMHVNYENAEITLVHDCFLRNLPWIDAETACVAILMSPWFSRGWTTLELVKSKKGSVKVAFKGVDRPLIKDLDNDILANHGSSSRHQLASSLIETLRGGNIRKINDLLTILGSRHTSWARDMAIISALLAGADIRGDEPQQEIYQAVLRKAEGLCHAHLFHNLPTISNGTSWAPVSLLDMPRPSTKVDHTLHVGECGEAVGRWKMVQLESSRNWHYIWKDVHPFVAAKVRSCLKLKDDHIFLAEPHEGKTERALLVKKLKQSTGKNQTFRCQVVGPVYFDQPKQLNLGSDCNVVMVNVQETRATAQDDCRANSVVIGPKGNTRDQHNHPSSVPKGHRMTNVGQRLETKTEIGALEDNKKSEAAKTSQRDEFRSPRGPTSPLAVLNELLEAAKKGANEKVNQLIDEGADIGFHDDNGRTPTSWAAEYGHYGVIELLLQRYEANYDCMDNEMNIKSEPKAAVERLIENFASVYDSKDKQGRTPLLVALQAGKSEIAILLLRWYETHYKFEPEDEVGRTPLWWAATQGYEEVVRLLLKKGAVVDVSRCDKDGSTALLTASQKGHVEVVKILLESGSDVNVRALDGSTALWAASQRGYVEIVKLLLIHGADVNALGFDPGAASTLKRRPLDAYDGSTALEAASEEGHKEVVRLLLDEAADIHGWRERNGRNALCAASQGRFAEVVKLLLVRYAVVNPQGIGDYSSAALWVASRGGCINTVRLLIGAGANVKVRMSGNSGTTVQVASQRGHTEIVKILLENGVDPDAMGEGDSDGTALQMASRRGFTEIVDLLLRWGAKIDKPGFCDLDAGLLWSADGEDDGGTALQAASGRGQIEVVKLLLDRGADINKKGDNDITALFKAAAGGHAEVLKLLLDKGAKIDIPHDNGMTARQVAVKRGHAEVVKLLNS